MIRRYQNAGFFRLRVNPEHVVMWKAEDTKTPGKGYGVEIQRNWYWYEWWVQRYIELRTGAMGKHE